MLLYRSGCAHSEVGAVLIELICRIYLALPQAPSQEIPANAIFCASWDPNAKSSWMKLGQTFNVDTKMKVRMARTQSGKKVILSDVHVALRRRDRSVTQNFLHDPQVGPIAQEKG